MISKTSTGKEFGRITNYVFKKEKKSHVVIANGVRSGSSESMAKDFERQAAARPRVKQKMLHITLSFHELDRVQLSVSKEAILLSWLNALEKKGFPLSQTQYAIIEHTNTPHPHFHIVVNMVGNKGDALKSNYIGVKCKLASIAITKKYGLTPAKLEERIKAENDIVVSDVQEKENNQKKGQSGRLKR